MQEKDRTIESVLIKEELAKFKSEHKCTACSGFRLKDEALCVKIANFHIGEVAGMSIAALQKWFSHLEEKLNKKQLFIAERILKEITERLKFLMNVGLDYLTLSREAGTLSGGKVSVFVLHLK